MNSGRPDTTIDLRNSIEVGKIYKEIEDDKKAKNVPKYFELKTTHTYPFFSNRHAFLRTYDEDMWERSKFSTQTETNAFTHDQV